MSGAGSFSSEVSLILVPVAQLDSALAYEASGRGSSPRRDVFTFRGVQCVL